VSAPGRFGCLIDRIVDRSRPFQGVHRWLIDGNERPVPYGSLERTLPFIRNQVAMQLRKLQG
jgi:hypothetical protein